MSNKMWGGRFTSKPDEIMEDINASIDFDKRLYAQDILGSKAHCQMLAAVGILDGQDADKICNGLDTILSEIESGQFTFSKELEDIHLNIENRLSELIGDAAGRLHTARSRNDQVATDFRLYVRDVIDNFTTEITKLQTALSKKAQEYADTPMPGFTHLQTAQPITFGHHLLAYVEMLERDFGRFTDARARVNQNPLGAAALAGTSFPIDRRMTTEKLGFDAPMENSIDAVSARDFAIETLSACALTAIHLSRLAEEIVVWMSAPFSFVSMSDKFTTGSSIMPQKRNPDAAELVRAKTGRIIGALNSLMVVMKGLPLAYSKDMQEDKEMAFDAFDSLGLGLTAMTGMIGDMQVNKEAMAREASGSFSTATDLADWLVRELKLPFRQAHHVTGSLVALAEQKKVTLDGLTLAEMQEVEAGINKGVFDVLSVENSVKSRISLGGTAPKNVEAQSAKWLKILETR